MQKATFDRTLDVLVVLVLKPNNRSRSLDPQRSGEDGLRIKQMAAIIVIIRIMISEREVGSLGLTGSH